LWVIWFSVALWLDGWRNLKSTPRRIYDAAKRGDLKMQGLALGIQRASFAWLVAAGVFYFTR
jgi:hypothetical protein